MKWLQVKLPDDMHKNFKRKCFDNDIDMSDEAVYDEIDEDNFNNIIKKENGSNESDD